MNKSYRIIWNRVRACFMVVGENARSVTKSGATARVTQTGDGKRLFTLGRMSAAFLLSHLAQPVVAQGQTVILPDGMTNTSLSRSGDVYDVRTGTQVGGNAFNSFQAFSVGSGSTVNMQVPSSASNLINIVRGARTDIYGTLNAYKNGQIGGNVWFANPNGFVVGASGVVNVGSLTVSTPSQAFVDRFFSAPGVPNADAVNQLLSGTAPRNASGQITIDGQVNAIDGVALSAGAINVGGAIYSGAEFVGSSPRFTDVVNVNGMESGSRMAMRNGRIEIVADDEVHISGAVVTDGGPGVNGGQIEIRAGGDLTLDAGAKLSAQGGGSESSGGSVMVWSDQDARFESGATINASAGTTGDGGDIEFSAKRTVYLNGGTFKAEAPGGVAGSILIDPVSIEWNGGGQDIFTNGETYTLLADESISLTDVYFSTRKIAVANRTEAETGLSTGNSGNLRLEAPVIQLTNSKLLAFANNGHVGGDITLDASDAGLFGGTAEITLTNAVIKGRNVTLETAVTADSTLSPLVFFDNHSRISLHSSQIFADGEVSLNATSVVNVDMFKFSPLALSEVGSEAWIAIDGASRIVSSGNTALAAESSVTTSALSGLPDIVALPGDAGVVDTTVISNAGVVVEGTTEIAATGALNVSATNTTSVHSEADAAADGAAAAGGSLAISVVTATTEVRISGQATVTEAAEINLSAEATHQLTTSAVAAAGGTEEQGEDGQGALKSLTEQALKDHEEELSTSDGTVGFAAAVGVSVLTTSTQAVIDTTGLVHTDGALSLTSTALNSADVVADGTSATGGIGAAQAVGLNIGVLSNEARIADNAQVEAVGITLSAVSPDGESNTFSTSATSGAGGTNVGVAGALGVNVLVNTTIASLEGDADAGGAGAMADAGGSDVRIEARNVSESTLDVGADVELGSGGSALVGVGASVGINVGVNIARAEIGDKAGLLGARDVALHAEGDHALSTTVQGGSAGASVAVTPVAAVSVGVNVTQARLGTGNALNQSGEFSSEAVHHAETTTEASGQTAGDKVSVGASLAVNVAVDTVTSSVERDLLADGDVTIAAESVARSSASATASVAGGNTADENDQPTDENGAPAKTVDEQSDSLLSDATKKGSDKDKNSKASGSFDLNKQETPKAETSEGGVSVAAAIGVNVGVATTVASVADSVHLTSGGALSVSSSAETDTQAKADGSQVDAGGTKVGVGAAVALNVGVGTNLAVIGDEAVVHAHGLTVSAVTPDGESNDFGAEAISGAGASEVGVAGALAVNVGVATNAAYLEGDEDQDGQTAQIDAGDDDVTITAQGASTSDVKATADVSADGGKAGVGVSLGLNVMVNTTTAEVQDRVELTGVDDLSLEASADHEDHLTVKGGAAGAKVSVTPVVGVNVSVNTTTARLGTLASTQQALSTQGEIHLKAEQTHSVSNEVSGLAVGDVAVGASLAGTVAVNIATASLERDVAASTGIDVDATSSASITTTVTAGAKGAKEILDKDGKQEAGTSVDEQKEKQLQFAAGKNDTTKASNLDTPKAETPETNTDESGKNKQGGKKVSVAAAIGVSVADNEAIARIGAGRTIATSGDLTLAAETHTNYATLATGEAVSNDIGVAAAVALTGTRNRTRAEIGEGTTISDAGDITLTAHAFQNRDDDFLKVLAAEAVSGAGGGDVAVAGALAVVANDNETRASINEGATLGADGDGVGNVRMDAQDTSKIAALARAGALAKGTNGESKAGIGASFAVLLSTNSTTASLGYDVDGFSGPTNVYANSVTLNAAKNRVTFNNPLDVVDFGLLLDPIVSDPLDKEHYVEGIQDFAIDTLDPTHYLGSNNYYTEAVAGAAAKGQAAVAGAFSVNVFHNTTQAEVAKSVNVTTYGNSGTSDTLGVDLTSRSDIQAIAFGGAVAGAKKAGVGITNVDILNDDEVLAVIGDGAHVTAQGDENGVRTSAEAKQLFVSAGVSAGAAQEGAGVGGILAVNLIHNVTQAHVGDGAVVKAQGHVDIEAASNSTLVNFAGSGAGGKEVGVGASIGANLLLTETEASIGENAEIQAKGTLRIDAEADEAMISGTIAGAGGGKVGVAGSIGINSVLTRTEASVGQGTHVNTDAAFSTSGQEVLIAADDSTVVVGLAAGGAGSKDIGLAGALSTNILGKSVQAFIADDTRTDGQYAQVNAQKKVSLNAESTDVHVSITGTGAGGGSVGVAGSVGLGLLANEVKAYVGKGAHVDTDGNLLVNAQDDAIAVLFTGSGAGGGKAGVGTSIGATAFIGDTRAFIAEGADVSARGQGAADEVYSGAGVIAPQPETPDAPSDTFAAKPTLSTRGVSVTAYNRETLVTAVVSGVGGGQIGVAVPVGANVIANNTEAYIDRGARVNVDNTGAAQRQEVRVAAVNEALLIDLVGGGAGGGQGGVGIAVGMNALSRSTQAWIGEGAHVKASQAVAVDATASAMTFSSAIGGAGGGTFGVGGSVTGIALADTTVAEIRDADSDAEAAIVEVAGYVDGQGARVGDLSVEANSIVTSWQLAGAGAGGGSAGFGGSLTVAVNASNTKAHIGDYAQTFAYATTQVEANSVENHNNAVIAGAGGGSVGGAGSLGIAVVSSSTEASIGQHARINVDENGVLLDGEDVDVSATDTIITVGLAGSGAGGGVGGVGASGEVLVALNTTSAYVDSSAKVHATRDVGVSAASDKFVNTLSIGGAGGGTFGGAGAISVLAVGSLLDGEAKSGLGGDQATENYADGLTTPTPVGDLLGDSAAGVQLKGLVDNGATNLGIKGLLADPNSVPLKNTQAFIGAGADVQAGRNVSVTAHDATVALMGTGSGAGAGAVSVAGALGVVLMHNSAEAFIGNGAQVDAVGEIKVAADTRDDVVNINITGGGSGVAEVSGGATFNIVSSDTAAHVNAAQLNQRGPGRDVTVSADSSSALVSLAGNGGGSGTASVGGVMDTNVLTKRTKAYIGDGALVAATDNVDVRADSTQVLVGGGLSIRGAGVASVAGVAGMNVVANTTEAFIGADRDDSAPATGATVDSDGNVTLQATDDSLVISMAILGSGGTVGVGGVAGANVVSSQTRSYISDASTVYARGNAAGVEVFDGTISSDLPQPVSGDPGKSIDVEINLDPKDVTADGLEYGDANAAPEGTIKDGVLDFALYDGYRFKFDGAMSIENQQGDEVFSTSGAQDELAKGGLGTKGKETVTGLSVVALGTEKLVGATLGVGGGGVAALGAATANLVLSTTEATVGDNVTINSLAAPGDVRVRAADNTFMAQATGILSVGGGAVSGAANTGIVAKTTTAEIGKATIWGRDVAVEALSSEDLYTITGGAGIGSVGVAGAAGVDVVVNTTKAKVGAGAVIRASEDVTVLANQDTSVNLVTFSYGEGATAGLSGGLSVGVIVNDTEASIDGATVDAGELLDVHADAKETILTATAGAAGGMSVGLAGTIGVKVVASSTQAFIGDNSRINQDPSIGGPAQDVRVTAEDAVTLKGGGASVGKSAIAAGGAIADVNIVRTTTTAYLGANVAADADRDLTVEAHSTKDVLSAVAAGGVGVGASVGGGVSIAVIGASLDEQSQDSLKPPGSNADTADYVDQVIKQDGINQKDEVDGADQAVVRDSEHVTDTKAQIGSTLSGLSVADKMNESSAASQDKTRAYIGSGSQISVGNDIKISARDTLKLSLNAVGAGAGVVGLGGAIGVGIVNGTTESFLGGGASAEAGGNITFEATADNKDSDGARVLTLAGGGGLVGASASIAVLDDTSTTRSYLANASRVDQAAALTLSAHNGRKATAESFGASVGGAAAGASVATATLHGSTSAYLATGAQVGMDGAKQVTSLLVEAGDTSSAIAHAVAGTGGVVAGSGAVAVATMESSVDAYLESNVDVETQDSVEVSASATPVTEASSVGVNIGLGAAAGASIATATSASTTRATLASDVDIVTTTLDVIATRKIGSVPSALAMATGASGGLLLGANATFALAQSLGETSARVGDDSRLDVAGKTTVKADSMTQQSASGVGLSFGYIALGADVAHANSDSLTLAVLGDDVKVTGGSLEVNATSDDTNYAYGVAGSGGVASAPFSLASTSNTSRTYAMTGRGENGSSDAYKIDVADFKVLASHTANFDSWLLSVNGALVGVSGAQVENVANNTTEARVGVDAYVEADKITVQADNSIVKASPAIIPGLSTLAGDPLSAPSWNVMSTSGGLADLPAAGSETLLAASAAVVVGAGAHLEQTGTPGPGSFVLDAWNDINAKDRTQLSSGGAISAASASSEIRPMDGKDSAIAMVQVGALAELSSIGDMQLGVRSDADIETGAAVDVYGLVGVAPFGSSTSHFRATNAIEIGTGAKLDSGADILMSAGRTSDEAENKIAVVARTDVYNNTAIPVNQDPVADAIVETRSTIDIGVGADVGAAGSIYLQNHDGVATASGVGIGKDIYREALAEVASAISEAFGGDEVSFETRTGRSIRQQSSSVHVDGSVHTGTQRIQELVIGFDGTATSSIGNIYITDYDTSSVAADIQNRIADLYTLIGLYSVDASNSDAAIAVAAYESEIAFLKRKLVEMGFGSGEVMTSNITPMDAAITAKTGMETTISGYEADKLALSTENSDLAGDNTELTTNNTTLANQNQTLNDNISTWTTERSNLDTNSPSYQDDYDALTTQINGAQSTITTNTQTIESNTTTIGGNVATIDANLETIDQLDADILRLEGQVSIIETKLANNEYSTEKAEGPIATTLTISDAEAMLGNIYVRGDTLSGDGTLDAPGDAQIRILSEGPNFLILKNLSIAPELGGAIYFNGVDVGSNGDINQINAGSGVANFAQVNTAGNSGTPTILVQSTYDPLLYPNYGVPGTELPAPAPDIILQGDISNLRGLVKIDTAAGSIRIEQKRDANGDLIAPAETASVRANEIQIETRNGDFVQSYTDSFVNTGGDPLSVIKDLANPPLDKIVYTPEAAGSGIVANGSVLIAARYLNINGIIQSGIAEWGVTVPSNALVELPDHSIVSFAVAKQYYANLSVADKAKSGAEYFEVTNSSFAGLPGADYTKITVRYNADKDRLELGGVQVQGGYISLFGQIFNTNGSGGELRVLDGYGTIQVDNQSSLPLWINTLDAGRGVSGQIDITNITGIDSQGRPIVTTTSYTRDPGEARTGDVFNPQAGLRYAMQVGSTEGVVNKYRYSSGAIIGIEVFPTQLDQYWVSKQTLNNDPIPNNGEFLGFLPLHSGDVDTVPQSNTTSSDPVITAQWFECNWATLCILGTYYKEFQIESSTKTITTMSLKADNEIKINYIGSDTGLVDVKSVGGLILNGSILNRNGDTTLVSSGSINQNSDLSIVGGNNVSLEAGSGIGNAGPTLQVLVNGGKLDASSGSGDIRIAQLLGDLNVGQVGGAGVANVYLEADRSLINFDSASYVQARRVELLSRNGGIGVLTDSASDPLIVRTGYTTNESQWPNNGLMATARDSINVRNEADVANSATFSGNLLLIAAESLAGDVRIETSGSVIDNNPYATTDTRSETDLAQLWDDLRLRGSLADDKADEAVAAYERGKDTSYQLYWQMRQRQGDGGTTYDPGFAFSFSGPERDALLASGMDDAQIQTLADNRTSQYHQLHAEVGELTTSFVAAYHYSASDVEKAEITQGSHWSDAQLALSVGAGLLKAITDTVTTIKEPNAKGRSVTLIAGENVGSFDPVQTINLAAGLDTLTNAQKAALAAAERGDATLSGDLITIVQPRPVNVTVGAGALDVAANGYAFIGSEADLRLNQVSAGSTGDIRIKTAGALVNAANPGSLNITSANLILESASGGIGSEDAPLFINLASGAAVTARAAGDIWLGAAQDMLVDTLFSRQDIHLEALGSILDAQADGAALSPTLNILGESLWFNALTGSIGTSGNALDVGVGRDGRIYASATTVGEGVWLNGTAGEYFNIGSVASGDEAFLSSATTMTIDGGVMAPGSVSLVAGGAIDMTENADVHATVLGASVRAGELTMADGARLTVDVGTIDITTVGDAIVTGIYTGNPTASAISVTSTGGRILAGHALGSGHIDITADTEPGAKLTLWAAQGIGDEPLNLKVLNFEAYSGGIADLAFDGAVTIDSLTAGDRIWLTAGGDVTGGAVSSTGMGGFHTDDWVSITTTRGSVNLTSVTGQGDIIVAAPTQVSLGTVQVGGDLYLASNLIEFNAFGTGNGPIGGSLGGYGGGSASNILASFTAPNGVSLDSVWTQTGDLTMLTGGLTIDRLIVGRRMTISNPQTDLLIDQTNKAIQPFDVQLYSGGAPITLTLETNHVMTNGFVINRDLTHEVLTLDGNQNFSATEQSGSLLAAIDALRPRDEDSPEEEVAEVIIDGIAVALEANDAKCDKKEKEECEEE